MRTKISFLSILFILTVSTVTNANDFLGAQAVFYYNNPVGPLRPNGFKVSFFLTPIPINLRPSDFKHVRHHSCDRDSKGEDARWKDYCLTPVEDGWTFQAAVVPVYKVERQIVDLETGALTTTKLPDLTMTVVPYSAVYSSPELPEVIVFDGTLFKFAFPCGENELYTPPQNGRMGTPQKVSVCYGTSTRVKLTKDARGLNLPNMLESANLEITALYYVKNPTDFDLNKKEHLRWEIYDQRP